MQQKAEKITFWRDTPLQEKRLYIHIHHNLHVLVIRINIIYFKVCAIL